MVKKPRIALNFVEKVQVVKSPTVLEELIDIVLSARSTESDKIMTLDCGANDYITKPFSTGELLARVRATLRVNCYNTPLGENRFTLQELTIDYDSRVGLLPEKRCGVSDERVKRTFGSL